MQKFNNMIEFYKPNKKNTGAACRFWMSTNRKTGVANGVMARIVKQVSYNDSTGKGSFRDNVKNPLKMVMAKFSIAEVCGIIDCVESHGKREIEETHSSEKQYVMINFGKYERDGNLVGYSFRVVKKLKEDSTQKPSFIFGFTFPEAILLKTFLKEVLRKTYTFMEEKTEDDFAAVDGTIEEKQSQPKPKEEPQDENDEEIW